jgi:hypothetical protein
LRAVDSNYDDILQIKDKLLDNWVQFQEKVVATMVEKQTFKEGEKTIIKYWLLLIIQKLLENIIQ